MIPKRYIIGICVLVVIVAVVIVVLLFAIPKEEKPQTVSKFPLRYGVYSHLDKLCKDVNALDKIQIAIYFLMQSWLKSCDSTPETVAFAPLKFMKKRIHDAVTKKIHDFNKQEERSVEDCIIEFYKTEIKPTTDDFHQLLFEMVLQGYVSTFGGYLDETGKMLSMESINCNQNPNCTFTFEKPPSSSKMMETIIKKSNEDEEEGKEKKCVQVFQYVYLWNEKIKKPEMFDWAYYLVFKGLANHLNMTDLDVKKQLHCASSRMMEMEKALQSKPDEVDPFLVLFLRERDIEMEVLEDEMEYTSDESTKEELQNRINIQAVLAELVLKTYQEMFNVTADSEGLIRVSNGASAPVQIEVPTMEYLPLL